MQAKLDEDENGGCAVAPAIQAMLWLLNVANLRTFSERSFIVGLFDYQRWWGCMSASTYRNYVLYETCHNFHRGVLSAEVEVSERVPPRE